MKITELRNEGLDLHLQVEIPEAVITGEIQKELGNLSKRVKLDGFRIGKVPLSIIDKKYGASVKYEVLQHQLTHAIDHIVKDKKLNIATAPAIEDLKNKEGEDLQFTLKFELIPTVEIPDLKKIAIELPVLEIGEDDIKEELENLKKFSTEYTKESKGKAAKKDQVTINLIGYIDGEPFEGGNLKNHKLVLGSNSFIDNFEEQLVEAKAGDKLTVHVTFPEDYRMKNLAGKAAEFEVDLLAIHKAVIPEINDEFAKNFNCETVEKLHEQIVKNIESSFADQIHTIMKMQLFDQLENILSFEVPKSLIEKERQILDVQTKKSGDSEQLLKDKSEQEINDYYQKLSLRRVRIGLLLAEYIKVKNLRIEPEDIKEAVMFQARSFPSQAKEIIEYYQRTPSAIESLKGPILEEKAVKHIFDQEVIVNKKKYSKAELEKWLEEENNREVI